MVTAAILFILGANAIDWRVPLRDDVCMGGLASGAMYLATTLASGPPPIVAADPVPMVFDAPVDAPARRAYVIVDLPAATGTRAEGVAAARRAIEPVSTDTAIAPEPQTASEADVVASHDQRIGLIRARLDVLRTDKADKAAIAMLDGRLRRAEAARQLAVARVALAQCGGPCAPRPVATVARSTATAAIEQRARTAPMPRRVAGSPPAPPTERDLAAPAGQSSKPRGQLPTGFSANAHAAPLDRARLLLAKARAALTDESTPKIELAGLWQWDGSEHWSLSAGPRRSA